MRVVNVEPIPCRLLLWHAQDALPARKPFSRSALWAGTDDRPLLFVIE